MVRDMRQDGRLVNVHKFNGKYIRNCIGRLHSDDATHTNDHNYIVPSADELFFDLEKGKSINRLTSPLTINR